MNEMIILPLVLLINNLFYGICKALLTFVSERVTKDANIKGQKNTSIWCKLFPLPKRNAFFHIKINIQPAFRRH